jgi:hypothetical protein
LGRNIDTKLHSFGKIIISKSLVNIKYILEEMDEVDNIFWVRVGVYGKANEQKMRYFKGV